MSVSARAQFRTPFSLASSPLQAAPKPHNAAHCGWAGERERGDHFLSDSARPVFRDWRDSTHSQRDCSKLSWHHSPGSALGFHEKKENLINLLKKDFLTFVSQFFFYLFLSVEAVRWFSPQHNGECWGRRHWPETRDSRLITVITTAVQVQRIVGSLIRLRWLPGDLLGIVKMISGGEIRWI